jgi:hypothetical protein
VGGYGGEEGRYRGMLRGVWREQDGEGDGGNRMGRGMELRELDRRDVWRV